MAQGRGLVGVALWLFYPRTLVKGFSSRVLHGTGRATALVSASGLYANNRRQSSFSSLIGDMASMFGGVSSVSACQSVDKGIDNLDIDSWDEIRSKLEAQQTPEELNFRSNVEKGYGDGSPLHKVRLFDESNREDDIRVTFFRDSASWCPYCQKVWASLEEKRIPYRVEKVNMRCYGDKPASFLKMQPGGQIPVAIIDGRVYGQSNDILYALEQLFPDHKSLLVAKGQEMEGQRLLRLERQIFSAWMSWLTGGRNKEGFLDTLDEVERSLSHAGPFFMGKDVTTVDFMFTPFLERMAASLLYFKGFTIRVPPGTPTDYPALNKWFDAMETLDSYRLTKSDYYTHCWDLPPQLGGCVYEKGGEKFEKAINGERLIDNSRRSWELPLQPHNGGVEPDWTWAGDENAAKREAVERLSANSEAISRFAARGAGSKGMFPFSAPLSDPQAEPNEAVVESVNAILRLTCLALLEGTESQDESLKRLSKLVRTECGQEFSAGVVASLTYLRDRVGVPRDMRLPAASQLRAHLNWAIAFLL